MAYYAGGAKSYKEIEDRERANRERAASNLRREAERAEAARRRRADRATVNLPNAIRRGDELAVRALLNAGADPGARTDHGEGMADYAERIGELDIALLLRSCVPSDAVTDASGS